jgi:hypothetical protein
MATETKYHHPRRTPEDLELCWLQINVVEDERLWKSIADITLVLHPLRQEKSFVVSN